jgi:hypothetical protein
MSPSISLISMPALSRAQGDFSAQSVRLTSAKSEQILDPATTRQIANNAVDPITGLTNTSGLSSQTSARSNKTLVQSSAASP